MYWDHMKIVYQPNIVLNIVSMTKSLILQCHKITIPSDCIVHVWPRCDVTYSMCGCLGVWSFYDVGFLACGRGCVNFFCRSVVCSIQPIIISTTLYSACAKHQEPYSRCKYAAWKVADLCNVADHWDEEDRWGLLYWHELTSIPAWISDYIHSKVNRWSLENESKFESRVHTFLFFLIVAHGVKICSFVMNLYLISPLRIL